MKKMTFIALASTFAIAACDDMGAQKTTTSIDYSNQTCDQLASLAVEKAEMAGIAHSVDKGNATQAVVGTVGGIAAGAPIAGAAIAAGGIGQDQTAKKVDAALKQQYDDIMAVYTAKGC